MGGGTILILILTLLGNIEQHVAQATNLIFFIPTSIATICINLKNKTINKKVGFIVGGTGTIGAIIGAFISCKLNTQILRKCFGVFLTIIALHEIYALIELNKKEKKHI